MSMMKLKRILDNGLCRTGSFIFKHRRRLPNLPKYLEWFRKDEKYDLLWLPIVVVYVIVFSHFIQLNSWLYWSLFAGIIWLQLVDSRTESLVFKKPTARRT